MSTRWAIAVVVTLVIAAALGAFAMHRGTQARDTSVASAEPGRLAINAYPWAKVTCIRNVATGVAVELDNPLLTPAAPIDLAAGSYEVTLSNPRFSQAIVRTVTIAPHHDAILNVEFASAPHARCRLTGDLDAADRELTSLLGAQPSGETYLLRGCTRYTRAVLSAAPDAELAAARADFAAALELDRDLRLDSSMFSPKLIAFFEEVRKGG